MFYSGPFDSDSIIVWIRDILSGKLDFSNVDNFEDMAEFERGTVLNEELTKILSENTNVMQSRAEFEDKIAYEGKDLVIWAYRSSTPEWKDSEGVPIHTKLNE